MNAVQFYIFTLLVKLAAIFAIAAAYLSRPEYWSENPEAFQSFPLAIGLNGAVFAAMSVAIIGFIGAAAMLASGFLQWLSEGINPNSPALPNTIESSEMPQTEMEILTLARDILRIGSNTAVLHLFSKPDNMTKLAPFIDDQGYGYYQGKPADYETVLNLLRDAARSTDKATFNDVRDRLSKEEKTT